jgi:CheY-like chemotaxis protein
VSVSDLVGVGSGASIAAVFDVLLVEDDAGDALLVGEALRDARDEVRLHVAGDGTQALAYLRRENSHATAPRRSVILLDLNLPGLDGRTVLTQIKADEALRPIPVVVPTSSHAAQNVTDSYHAHANAYITKPIDAVDFAQVTHLIAAFFTIVVKLPH